MTRLRTGFGKHKKEVKIVDMDDGHVAVRISLGKRKVTHISLSDIGILKEHSFYAHKRSDGQYVARSSQKKGAYLHRLLLLPEDDQEVDHVNSDPLNNTRGNLRVCSKIQNNLAKDRETVEGFYGIKQTRFYSQRIRDHGVLEIQHNWFKAIGPDGKLAGGYRTAFEAAKKRDELMIDEYETMYCEVPFHNYGYIHWNVEHPVEATEMEDWLFDERNKAQSAAVDILEEFGWS
ncbi:MAG: hypothetical protein RPT25_15005 [Cycloclasticus sp.]